MPVIDQYKFCGIIFDKKTYLHLYLKEKGNKALKFLHIITDIELGTHQQTLLKLYRTLICLKIDYNCFI